MKLRQAKKVVSMLRCIRGQMYSVHRYSTAEKAHARIRRFRHMGHARPEFSRTTIWFDETAHYTGEDWRRAGLDRFLTVDEMVV